MHTLPLGQLLPAQQGWPAPPQATQLPLLQTLLLPQALPSGAAPVSIQTDAPVPQLVLPTLQADGSQAASLAQATQLPPLHTRPWPQVVPSGASCVGLHSEAPVAQLVVPSLHGSPVAQATAALHATQLPLPQTWSLPQGVPFTAGVPLSLHWGMPLLQSSTPRWQRLLGVQGAPSLQARHEPALQISLLPLPHALPLGNVSAGAQISLPLLQSMRPWRQTSGEGQAAPARQVTHSPAALQALSGPQGVPGSAAMPLSLQVAPPLVQSSTPR
jgi:hypothetical protein